MANFFARFQKQVNSVLAQAGVDYDVHRNFDTGTTDRFGKEGVDRRWVGTVRAVVFYGSRNNLRSDFESTSGYGAEDTPRAAFSPESVVREDDYLEIHDRFYRVVALSRYPTHMEARLEAESLDE